MRDLLKYDFGEIAIYEHYIIVVMKEGIIVKPEHNEILIKVVATYFADQSFGYITHRKNSYSVDTSTYVETSKIETLIGFAIVSEDEIRKENSKIEKQFLRQPLKTFTNLIEAKAWINSLILV